MFLNVICLTKGLFFFYSSVADLNSKHFHTSRCSIVNTFCPSFVLFPVDVSVYNCREILPWSQSFEPFLTRLRSGIMTFSFGPQVNQWYLSFYWDFKMKDKFYAVRWQSIIGQKRKFCKLAPWCLGVTACLRHPVRTWAKPHTLLYSKKYDTNRRMCMFFFFECFPLQFCVLFSVCRF